MGKKVLKDFIQSLQNRIMVAASLAVLKSKPADVTGEQHAQNIQQLVYDNWVKDNYFSSFENKIIELQKEELFKDINELLLPKEHTNFLLRPIENNNLLLRLKDKLNESYPDVYLEGDTSDESVPNVCLGDTLNESFPGVFSELALDEFNPDVYLKEIQDDSFAHVCSEEYLHNELMSDVCSEGDTPDELIPGVCSEEYFCGELNETNSDIDGSDLFENNISFIQAIVQLKFAAFSNGCVTADTIKNVLDKFVKNEILHKYRIKNMVSIRDADRAGFGELSACTIADLKIDQMRVVINSSRTESLIQKCLSSVIHFAYKNIHNNADTVFYSWHGSLMEYLCSVLEDISFHPVCTEYLLKLILKCLDDIWSSEDSSKHTSWEHQQHILSFFCVNSHICESVTDFIMVKFDILINLMNTIEIGSIQHLVGIHLIEKVPHFSRFLCIVIKKLQFYKAADISPSENQNKYSKSIKVTDLWKLKWRVNEENEQDHKKKIIQVLLKRWKDICEKLIIMSAANFPLISIYIWDIMKTLQDWNAEIKES